MNEILKDRYQSDEGPMAIETLKTFLWGSATLLRSKIEATGYKEYIFPLFFYKRMCDVYDERFSLILHEPGGDIEYANSQIKDDYFVIPKDYHWNQLRSQTENIGQFISDAFTTIESENPSEIIDNHPRGGLTGIFGDKSIWLNKQILSDEILKDLVEYFSRHTLDMKSCPADEMGLAYEYLIGMFADDAGHGAQEFFTNRTVVDLMSRILKPKSAESVYDPTCGTGGMLIKCLNYVKEHEGESVRNFRIYGQERNILSSNIARMNLFLHGINDYCIARADTLEAPAFIENGKLQQFDIVLANPPYSIKNWNRELFANDPYGRNIWGVPPQGRADYAFFQHIAASMNKTTGRCAILFPHGVLFRNEEKEMREKLVRSDLIEAVIGIGANLFFNSPMEACVVILKTRKPAERVGKILFVNAKHEVTRKNAQSYLEECHIEKIVDAYDRFCDIPEFANVATMSEIADNGFDISIAKYVDAAGGSEDIPSLEEAAREWLECHQAIMSTLEMVNGALNTEKGIAL